MFNPPRESLRARIEHFFFALEVPYGLALVRITLPLVLMSMVLPRWMVVREVFSSDGATTPLAVGFGYVNLLPEFSGSLAMALYSIMVFALVCASAGWHTRLSLIVANVLFTYFCLLDAASTMTKYTVIATHVLFILALSECGSLWSVDAWLAGRKRSHWPGEPAVIRDRFPVWPRRLLQLHIGAVYFGAAVTKMHTPTFFTGDQLQSWMLTHLNYGHPLGEYLGMYPIVLVMFGHITIVWEILFLFIAWKSHWRMVMLPIGICFHFMTTLTLGLLLFPMICYCTYLSFLDEEDMQWISARVRRWMRSSRRIKGFVADVMARRPATGQLAGWRKASLAGFTFVAAAFAMVNVELEYRSDPFGERRPEGRYQLVTIEPERAQKMLAPIEPQRDADKFFAVDTGTILVGDLLANRRTQFRKGEKMIAQCNLTPPHEDMWIECKIRDSDNRLVDRLGAVAPRETYRANFTYNITDSMPVGDYTIVIETAGRQVMQKKISVLARYGQASAN